MVPRLCLLTAILLGSLSLAAQQAACPLPPALQPPPPGADMFSAQQEADLGDAMAEHIQRNFRLLDDPQLSAELERIAARLLQNLPPSQVHYRFFVIDLPEVNAFTIPGRVYVSRKLIAFAQNEDELAGILAHELGHGLTHQMAMEMTARFRAVLGVTSVGDRDDVYRKYHQYLENSARKPGRSPEEDRDQSIADQVAIYALARSGYVPGAFAGIWDRAAHTQGRTGSWFSDLFGETRPEERRLRDMRKAIAALSPACVLSTSPQNSDSFRRWQVAVVEYSGVGRQERLPGLLSRESLDPPLQADLTRLRFSPDGRYLLAQDEAGITVLSKEPLAVLFHVDAPDARPALFSSDSRSLLVYTDALRVESWDVAVRARSSVREVATGFGRCAQTRLSPDGRWIACLTASSSSPAYDLAVLKVAAGNEIFRKKEFYQLTLSDLINRILMRAESEAAVDLVGLQFSPDSRYLLAGAINRSTVVIGMSDSLTIMPANSNHTLAVDLAAGKEASLNGSLRDLLVRSFTFLSDGSLAGVNNEDPKKSGVLHFPDGKKLSQFSVGFNQIEAASSGDYLLVRPIADAPVGMIDLKQNKLVLGSRTPALDCYNGVVAVEQRAGQVALYQLGNPGARSQVDLPQPRLGSLRAAAASPDLHWLAVSGRDRGAIWNLEHMRRLFMLRAFEGAWFDEGQFADLDFPEYQKTERMIARAPLFSDTVVPGFPVSERGRQFGRFLLLLEPQKKGGSPFRDVTLEVHDVRTDGLLWSRPFPELPGYSANATSSSLSLLWPSDSSAFKEALRNSPALKAGAEKDDVLLQVFDFESGKQTASLLIKTGKRSLHVDDVGVDGDWALVRSGLDTFLLYSLASGQLQARFFGAYGALSATAGMASIENEPGQVTLYDLATGAARRQISLTSPLAFQRFSADGKRLLLVSRDQNVYFFDPAAPADTRTASAP